MSQELDILQQQVQATTTVEASAVLLIQGLAAQLITAKDDPVKVQALIDALKEKTDALSLALVANTTPAPTPPPTP